MIFFLILYKKKQKEKFSIKIFKFIYLMLGQQMEYE